MGPVNNFGTSRENREMGQDLEWDNGDEATTHTVQHYHCVLHWHTLCTTYRMHCIICGICMAVTPGSEIASEM